MRCAMPFSLTYFGHRNIFVELKLSDNVELVRCRDCGKEFVMNNLMRVILPYDGDIKEFYDRRK